jgi:tetratricopeptide (TPR) repeat protein
MYKKITTLIAGLLLVAAAGCSFRQSEADRVHAKEDLSSTNDPQIKAALALIDKMPNATDGYVRLAGIYIRKARETGDFSLNSKAQTAVDKALEIVPNDISARKLHASLHLTFHRFAEGLEAGKALQKEFPDDAFVYGVLTDANAELGNYDAAVDAAQKMVDLKPNAASYARVGHIRSLYGDHKGAIEMLALAAQVTDPMAGEARAWCLVQLGDEYWKHGQFAESEKAYDEALTAFPNYYFALAGKGRARAALNDPQGAEKYLVDSQNRAPYVETIIFLGDLYSAEGDSEKAKQQYDLVEVVEKKLGLNNDQKRLAMLWADHDTRLDEALEIANREYAVRQDIITADTAAWCRYKRGDLQGAKAAVDDAMKLKTNDARILYHAAMIEKALGDKAQAKKLLESALRINPVFDLVQAPVAKKELSEMK